MSISGGKMNPPINRAWCNAFDFSFGTRLNDLRPTFSTGIAVSGLWDGISHSYIRQQILSCLGIDLSPLFMIVELIAWRRESHSFTKYGKNLLLVVSSRHAPRFGSTFRRRTSATRMWA